MLHRRIGQLPQRFHIVPDGTAGRCQPVLEALRIAAEAIIDEFKLACRQARERETQASRVGVAVVILHERSAVARPNADLDLGQPVKIGIEIQVEPSLHAITLGDEMPLIIAAPDIVGGVRLVEVTQIEDGRTLDVPFNIDRRRAGELAIDAVFVRLIFAVGVGEVARQGGSVGLPFESQCRLIGVGLVVLGGPEEFGHIAAGLGEACRLEGLAFD